MKIRVWVALAITYVLLVSMAALLSYFLVHILLQMPLMDVYIVTGFLILAVTLGMVVAIIILLAKQKK
jgi:hypothetical protein